MPSPIAGISAPVGSFIFGPPTTMLIRPKLNNHFGFCFHKSSPSRNAYNNKVKIHSISKGTTVLKVNKSCLFLGREAKKEEALVINCCRILTFIGSITCSKRKRAILLSLFAIKIQYMLWKKICLKDCEAKNSKINIS